MNPTTESPSSSSPHHHEPDFGFWFVKKRNSGRNFWSSNKAVFFRPFPAVSRPRVATILLPSFLADWVGFGNSCWIWRLGSGTGWFDFGSNWLNRLRPTQSVLIVDFGPANVYHWLFGWFWHETPPRVFRCTNSESALYFPNSMVLVEFC